MTEEHHNTAECIRELCHSAAAPWRAMIDPAPVPVPRGRIDLESERFLNPRGAIVRAVADSVLERLQGGRDHEALGSALRQYMKLKALEAGSAREAVMFLEHLKSLVRDLASGGGKPGMIEAAHHAGHALDEMITAAACMFQEYRLMLADLGSAEKRRCAVRALKHAHRHPSPAGEAGR